ncbi:MAG: prephenate dehydratase [Myxococcota bacterium]
MDLDELRAAIDAIDDEMLDLLRRRAELIPQIQARKAATGVTTVDPKREQAIFDRLLQKGAGPFPAYAIKAVFREIMSASVSMQKKIAVSYLGPEGTYSHLAAQRLFGYAPTYREEATIAGVVQAVRDGQVDHGVVPIENSTEGTVTSALDALLEGGCAISQELILGIEHCLLARTPQLADVRRVYSHPQALAQCRDWLHANLPRVQLVHTESTTAAVRKALSDDEGGAIASSLASEIFSVPVLRTGVQDRRDNATRFIVVSQKDASPTGDDRTSIAFHLGDDQRPGSLHRVLSRLEEKGVNLTRIESRPRREQAWRYVFIADLEGHRDDRPISTALAGLTETCEWLLILGSYPRHRAEEA